MFWVRGRTWSGPSFLLLSSMAKDLPAHDDLPDHLFGHQKFRRLTFREHMLEEYPQFAARLRDQFAAEDAEKASATGSVQ